LKLGISLCETDWFICVDSDDMLTPDAVSAILEDIEEIPEHCAGYIYPQRMNGGANTRWIPEGILEVDIPDVKNLYGICETAILFKTEILKKVDIPVFEGEKFLSEEVIYIQVSELGKFIPKKRWFYISEYCPDGLTNRVFQHWMYNPKGTQCLLKKRFVFCGRYPWLIRVRERTKCIMNYNAICKIVGVSIFHTTPSRPYSAILYLPSLIWKKIRFGSVHH